MAEHVRLPIEGMTCASCVSRITRAIRKLDGVEAVRVDLRSDAAEVSFDRSRTSLSAVADACRSAGYEAQVERAEPFIPIARRGFLSRLGSAGRRSPGH
jgi:copper ion binding protein